MEDAKIGEFVNVTQATVDVAHSFLERANGDLPLAVSLYLAESEPGSSASSAAPSASSSAAPSVSNSQAPSRSSSSANFAASARAHQAPKSRFATFSDLAKQEEESERNGANSQDPHNLFTGGERSGLAVTPQQQNPSDLVNKIVQQAQMNAPRPNSNFDGYDEEEEEDEAPRVQQKKQPAFKGKGARLGTETDPSPSSEPSPGPSSPQSPPASFPSILQSILQQNTMEEDEDSSEVQERTLNFWNEGFSVDDGPLYRFDDPANQAYLRSIHSGRAPMSLLNVKARQPVDVKVVERHSPYIKPAATLQNTGPGQRLGSPTPSDQAYILANQTAAQMSAQNTATSSAPAEPQLGREGNAAVQVRLADGSVRRARFDRDGPVQQLYDYVDELSSSTRPYVLQLPMPPKKLDEKQQSLGSAGAVGAVVVQRWT